MRPSVVMEKHYPIQELASAPALDGLFEPQQSVTVLLSGMASLDVYASRLINLTPPGYVAPCKTLLSVYLFSSCDTFVKHAPLLRDVFG
ncbi:hypothetical protein CEXT_383221 [Caerostris extrusa]|uniref:Uncharacterized protein n=1 Tax=Caerostris extrusa TaxID=172846 RepID=A0AAV4MY22_CAEEX|nr:hypothetical protein CEXT_383221 [Caerostris extrusa]